ncbi:uncharacterized protein LOC108903601 [Anoplophora glabripennis]|uniref:Uncharacterized protein n=1 Tax=Anoplophora glabripennis TaxID=217634 RepID=V5GGM7_ANOGL|nr:uncharacterized protein LOC108903601 [Anoplophora glabripennis]XP_018561347.1 uncharacterized protein LOC108903601 [Anoplophora glabripennis]
MKTFVLLAVLGFALALPQYDSNHMVVVRDMIGDFINKTINSNLANLTEPVTIDSLHIDFDSEESDTLSGALNVTDAHIIGIKNLVAKQISVNLTSMDVDLELEINKLIVNLDYWADMVLLKLLPLYGSGKMNIVLEDFDVTVAGHADITDGISLDNVTIGIGLSAATFDLHGLIDNTEFSSLISAALNDNFVTFVNEHRQVVTNLISPIVENILHQILNPSNDDDDTLKKALLIEEYKLY